MEFRFRLIELGRVVGEQVLSFDTAGTRDLALKEADAQSDPIHQIAAGQPVRWVEVLPVRHYAS